MSKNKKSKDAQQDKRIAKVERMVNQIEVKQAEPFLIGLTAMALIPTYRCITTMAQGITKYTRIGNKIQPIELLVNWLIQNTDPANTLNARALIVRLERPNSTGAGNLPNFNELFCDPSAAGSVFAPLAYNGSVKYNNRGYENDGPLTVLWDSGVINLHPVNAAATLMDSRFTYNIRKRIKCNLRKQANFDDTTAASNQNGHYFLITFATGVTAFERGSLSCTFADS